jgi:hypothetical protein
MTLSCGQEKAYTHVFIFSNMFASFYSKVTTVDDVDDLSIETRFDLVKVISRFPNPSVLQTYDPFRIPPSTLESQDYYSLLSKTALGGSDYIKYFETPWDDEVFSSLPCVASYLSPNSFVPVPSSVLKDIFRRVRASGRTGQRHPHELDPRGFTEQASVENHSLPRHLGSDEVRSSVW